MKLIEVRMEKICWSVLLLLIGCLISVSSQCPSTSEAVTITGTSIATSAYEYCGTVVSLTVASTIISIGAYAFQQCASLNQILFINGLTVIGIQMFYMGAIAGPTVLRDITIPSTITSMGQFAFSTCSALTNVMLNTGLTVLAAYVFDMQGEPTAASLTSVIIPSTLTSIGSGAFLICYALTAVTFISGLTFIGDSMFNLVDAYPSNIVAITIPSTVTAIGSQAFAYNSAIRCVYWVGLVITSPGNIFQGDPSAIPCFFPPTIDPTVSTTSFPTISGSTKSPSTLSTLTPTEAPSTLTPTEEPSTLTPTEAPSTLIPTSKPSIKPTRQTGPDLTRRPSSEPFSKSYTKQPFGRRNSEIPTYTATDAPVTFPLQNPTNEEPATVTPTEEPTTLIKPQSENPTIASLKSSSNPSSIPSTKKIPSGMPLLSVKPSLIQESSIPSSNSDYYWSISLLGISSTNIYVSSSKCGKFLAAISVIGRIGQEVFMSRNSGLTWSAVSMLKSPPNGWATISVSKSGQFVALSTGPQCIGRKYSQVLVSNDFGFFWKISEGLPFVCNGFWEIIYSQDERILYAITRNGQSSHVHKSTDYGLSWIQLSSSPQSPNYSGIVTSIDGKRVNILSGGSLYHSDDFGESWIESHRYFQNCDGKPLSIASSSTGQYMVVISPCKSNSFIYISSTFGKSWDLTSKLLMSSNSNYIVSLSISSSGQFVVASFETNGMYISRDYGNNWVLQNNAPISFSISMIGSGSMIIAGTIKGKVYLGKSFIKDDKEVVIKTDDNTLLSETKLNHKNK